MALNQITNVEISRRIWGRVGGDGEIVCHSSVRGVNHNGSRNHIEVLDEWLNKLNKSCRPILIK